MPKPLARKSRSRRVKLVEPNRTSLELQIVGYPWFPSPGDWTAHRPCLPTYDVALLADCSIGAAALPSVPWKSEPAALGQRHSQPLHVLGAEDLQVDDE